MNVLNVQIASNSFVRTLSLKSIFLILFLLQFNENLTQTLTKTKSEVNREMNMIIHNTTGDITLLDMELEHECNNESICVLNLEVDKIINGDFFLRNSLLKLECFHTSSCLMRIFVNNTMPNRIVDIRDNIFKLYCHGAPFCKILLDLNKHDTLNVINNTFDVIQK